jgi:predicted RNase H-like nuclease (RuvC/YqgF family)
LLFVRDLVNNLNCDNEVLSKNIEDLKMAFLFLFEKHKSLMGKFKKEQMNRQVVEGQRARIEELQNENANLGIENLKLRTKVGSLFDILRLSWEEHDNHA